MRSLSLTARLGNLELYFEIARNFILHFSVILKKKHNNSGSKGKADIKSLNTSKQGDQASRFMWDCTAFASLVDWTTY